MKNTKNMYTAKINKYDYEFNIDIRKPDEYDSDF